jgi:hypothetical protein
MLERFNRTAELKGWPIRLGWFGLEPAGPAADGGATPGGSSAVRMPVAFEDPPEAEAAFRGLIRRFAQPGRLDEVLSSDRSSSCHPEDAAGS